MLKNDIKSFKLIYSNFNKYFICFNKFYRNSKNIHEIVCSSKKILL